MSFFVNPGSQDYLCSRNGVWRRSATFQRNGVAVNLTGWLMVMQIRYAPDNTPTDPPPLLTINSTGPTPNGSRITFTDVANGVFERYISNLDLLSLPLATKTDQQRQFAYDLVFHEPSPGTDFCPVLQGAFAVDPGVTY